LAGLIFGPADAEECHGEDLLRIGLDVEVFAVFVLVGLLELIDRLFELLLALVEVTEARAVGGGELL